MAQFLSEFIVRFGLKDIHIITYSLGSHTANYIARAMRPLKLKRITALDPPALFVPDGNKLSVADAEFIDSFYTSALTLGQTRGHAAFYFNGGFIQPGCYLGELKVMAESRPILLILLHFRNVQPFTGS